MDSFASLALATEPPSDALLAHPPHKRTEYLISKYMFSFIIAQAFYQLVVMLVLVFAGDLFIPESRWGNVTDQQRTDLNFCEFSDCAADFTGTLLRSGREYFPFSAEYDFNSHWVDVVGPSRHTTIIFNTFVFLQVFNLLNARNPSRNLLILHGVWNNRVWIGVCAFIVTVQALIVEFGGVVFSCALEGLTWEQWLICLAFGAGGIIVHLLMRLFPSKVLPEAGDKEIDLEQEPRSLALASRGRFSKDKFTFKSNLGSDIRRSRGVTSQQSISQNSSRMNYMMRYSSKL